MSEKLNLVAYETAFMVCTMQPELASSQVNFMYKLHATLTLHSFYPMQKESSQNSQHGKNSKKGCTEHKPTKPSLIR